MYTNIVLISVYASFVGKYCALHLHVTLSLIEPPLGIAQSMVQGSLNEFEPHKSQSTHQTPNTTENCTYTAYDFIRKGY